jgi:hypothetical protein
LDAGTEHAAQAEQFYKTALEQKPDDVTAMRRLVQFYFKHAQAGPPDQFLTTVNKAIPYLDEIVKKSETAKDSASSRDMAWARRTKAEIIASAGGYDNARQRFS